MPFIEVSEFIAKFEKMKVHEEKKQYVYKYVPICSYFHEGKKQFLYKTVKMEVHKAKKENNSLVAQNFFKQNPKNPSTIALPEIDDKGVRRSENLEVGGRAVGRSENPGVPVLFGGHNLPKTGGAMAPPAPPRTTSLGGAPSEPSVQPPLSMPVINYGEKQHKCSECSFSFTTKYNLNRHISIVHERKKVHIASANFCRQSPKKHSTTTLPEIHDRGVRRSENLKVGGAPSEPSVQPPLSMPVICYGEKQYKCSECSSSFLTGYNLNRHISMYHERKKKNIASVHERKKPFNCEICDYSCTQKNDMTQHVSSVHDICNYSYFLKHDIKKHLESVHEEKKSFKCDIQNEKKHIQTNSSSDGDAKDSKNQLIQGFLDEQILLFNLAGGTPSALPVQPPLPKGQLISE